MGGYKTDQRRMIHRGREFHFVSYEAVPGNPRLGQGALPQAWFLMIAGKRWLVMPQVPNQSEDDLNLQLHHWLDSHVFLGQPSPPASPIRRSQR